MREALRRGGDAAYLADCADDESVRRLAAAVEPYDAARVGVLADVPVDDLTLLDRFVASAGRVAVETGTGVTMNRHANVPSGWCGPSLR